MGLYNNNAGVLTPIAGRGKAEYGASTVRKGTITNSTAISAGSVGLFDITFDSPMPDTDYEVDFELIGLVGAIPLVINKTVNGFRLSLYRYPNTSTAEIDSIVFNYTAFKLYTDNEYNDLLNTVNGDSTYKEITITTYGGKIRYLKRSNVVSVFIEAAGTTQNIAKATSVLIGTLPEGYRPFSPATGIGTVSTAIQTSDMKIVIGTDGKVYIRSEDAAISSGRGLVTYVVSN